MSLCSLIFVVEHYREERSTEVRSRKEKTMYDAWFPGSHVDCRIRKGRKWTILCHHWSHRWWRRCVGHKNGKSLDFPSTRSTRTTGQNATKHIESDSRVHNFYLIPWPPGPTGPPGLTLTKFAKWQLATKVFRTTMWTCCEQQFAKQLSWTTICKQVVGNDNL